MTKTLSKSAFNKLLSDIRNLISSSKKELEEVVRKQTVLTYWQVGKRISEEKLSDKANYSGSIMIDLAKDLDIHKDTLHRSIKLFRTYPDSKMINDSNLTWSHYRHLISISNSDLRSKLEIESKKENWNVSKLSKEIDRLKEGRGEVVSSNSEIVRPIKANYLYEATIINVIDGDTLLLDIDLGFNVIKRQRVRLNQIDAKDIKTKEGKEAFNYLRDLSVNLSKIVVRTSKIDIYGRYLSDIFYSITTHNNKTDKTEVFEKGIYLNEELVEKGLVKIL